MSSIISLAQAKAAIENENNELAFSILGQYLVDNKNDPDGWILMAQVAQEPQQIIDCLERVVKLRPNIAGLKEWLEKIKSGPLGYYNQFYEIIRGYGQWDGKAIEDGKYMVYYEIKNNVNEIKDLLITTKKQQRHLQELQKHVTRSEDDFWKLLPLNENSPTHAGEVKLIQATSPMVLGALISQVLEQYKKLVFDLEIKLEKKMREGKESDSSNPRHPIPDDVKMFVWQRDQGKCVKCGSQINLEFDHIIPVSKGGSNTARNIQLLCESCNRKKSNNI